MARALAAEGRRHDWLARQLGIDKTLLSHYLGGRRKPPETFYARTAELLDVPEAQLKDDAASRAG